MATQNASCDYDQRLEKGFAILTIYQNHKSVMALLVHFVQSNIDMFYRTILPIFFMR